MTSRWWRPAPLTQGTEPEPDLMGPPAALLRLPLPFRVDEPAREEAARPAAAGRRDSHAAGGRIGTPVSRFGAARLWRAKSVDLRRLLFGFVEGATFPPKGPASDRARRQGGAPGEEGLSPQEELARRLAVVLQPPPEILLTGNGPLQWPGSFYPYQLQGIQALVQSHHLLLGDDMGLGKTIMAIAALRLLLVRREIERALVVTPAGLLEQWRRELLLWAPELRVMPIHGSPESRLWRWQYGAHVTLTSYDILRSDFTGSPTCGPCRARWGVVVLDEAQRIKNRETEISQVCKRLPRDRSWALTGTPLENDVEDLRSILEFVTGEEGSSVLASGFSLRAALGQYQLRRRKADVLQELPPKIVSELVLPLTPAQRRAYERAEREGLVALRERGEVRIESVLALITRLKQICNFAPGGDASAKMEDLEGRLEELSAEGHKALVFTQFTGDDSGARRIAARLQRFAPLLYTGDMSLPERARTVERFQQEEEARVLVLSLKAGGQGLNLQRASYVFHFDRWWNPAVERQAEDRSHRLGQTQPVHVYRYVMADTIEERIDALLKQRTHLFEQLVDGASMDLSRLLEQRDLFGLLGLEPPHPQADTRPPRDPTGASLERQVFGLLARQGYQVRRVGGQGDGGIDLVAEKRDALGTRSRLYIQCKDTERAAGVEAVRALIGALPPAERGVTAVLVCPAGFTDEARSFAEARQIQLWDAKKLEGLR